MQNEDRYKAPVFEIIEDVDNIYIFNYTIPKENTKENLKKREKLIWGIYGCWCVENPNKKCFNKDLRGCLNLFKSSYK